MCPHSTPKHRGENGLARGGEGRSLLNASHSNINTGPHVKPRSGFSCPTRDFVCSLFPGNQQAACKAAQRSRQLMMPCLLPSLPCATSAKVLFFTTTAQPKSWKCCRDMAALKVPTSSLPSPRGQASSTSAASPFSRRQDWGKGWK